MEQEFFDASAVNDLETARLALRWALERIHKMDAEAVALREDRDKSALAARQLSEEVGQKDEAVKRWKETIRAWESSMSDHKKMEETLRKDLRKELFAEEDLRVREE